MSQPLLSIIGPTAVGKTDLYFKLVADGFPFVAISADSRQVYRHLDIGTGKDLPADSPASIQLVDVVNPDQPFSSAQFCRLANQAIIEIQAAGQLPLIIGGTGRYIKDLSQSPPTLTIPPNPQLRQELSTYTLDQLQHRLKLQDPTRYFKMNHSDQLNPRRLVRAIEVSLHPSSTTVLPKHQLHMLGLTAPLQLIKSRISTRVHKRIEQGMISEVEALLKRYPDFSTYQSSMTPGYQEIISYLHHRLSLETALETWTKREFDYAKRQLTWFKHQTDAVWFDISHPTWYAEAVIQLQRWGYASNHSQD